MDAHTTLSPRVIPVLLLKGQGLVKGVRFKGHVYLGDPINAARIFNDKQVDELIFLDISATEEGRGPSPELVRRIAEECYMPFVVGGGVSSCAMARELLMAGAEKVSVNSAALERPALISELSGAFGSQSVVAAVDYAKTWTGKTRVFARSGRRKTPFEPLEWALKLEELGAGEIFLNCIDRDGMMSGYDLEMVSKVSAALRTPLIASGGAGSLKDLGDAIRKGGAAAAAAGAMFVLHGPRRAPLISFPSKKELETVYEGV